MMTHRNYIISLSTILWWGVVFAQPEHTPLDRISSLSFADVFSSALETAPEYLEIEPRSAQASAHAELGNSLFAASPNWNMSYYDDRALDSTGLRELEAGLQLSLWRPGERNQARRVGQRYDLLNTAWTNNLKLDVAGRVRSVFAELMKAESLLQLEQQSTTDAERLVEVSTALYESGAVPELDVMQSQSLLLKQRRRELAAEAAMVDAEREYTVITGLTVRPAEMYSETQNDSEEISRQHPLLAYLQANVELADANIERTRQQARNNPQVTLGVRRERGARPQPYTDSLALSFSIPIGKSSVAEAQVSNARLSKTEVEVAYQRAYIDLNRQLHEVEHQLSIINEEIGLNESAVRLSQQRWDMARTAYELGETDILAVVLAMQAAHESQKAQQSLVLDRQRLITEYNQTLGIMP